MPRPSDTPSRHPRRHRLRAIAASALIASVLGTVAEGVLTAAPASAAGQPSQLVFTTEPPSTATAGQSFPIAVTIEDAQGNVVTSDTDSITLTQLTYAPSSGFSCTGGFSKRAVAGVATFSCLLDLTGDYAIGASDDNGTLNNPTSSFVGINAGPVVALAFTVQPVDASTGAPFLAEVSAVDSFGNNSFSDNSDEVALGLSGGTSGAGLSCTPSGAMSPSNSTTVSFGVADFLCAVDTAGTGYTLGASNPNGSLASITSSPFDIGAESAALAMDPSPALNLNGNGTFDVDVTLTGAQGQPVSGHQVEIDFGPGQTGSGYTATTDQNGDAVIAGVGCSFAPTFQLSAVDLTTHTQLATIDASCVGVNFPTQDSVGFTDSFNVLSAQPSEPVAVSFAATPQSTPVAAALSGTCATDGSGDLAYGSCSFTVPSVPGATPPSTVTAFVTVGTGATAATYEIDGFQLLPATSIQLTPSSGPPGTVVGVALGGFGPGERVDVDYGSLGFEGDCFADPSGVCTASITVPALPAGSYVVEAQGASTGELADATFAETSSVSVSPGDVSADSNVSLAMAGFGADEVVNLNLGGVAAGSCTTDSTGSCSTGYLVPGNQPGGTYAVIATGAASNDTASTTLAVAGVQLSPSTGVAGTVVTASGADFQPGETVDVFYNGVKQTSCAAGPTGACSASLTVPAGEARSYTVIATGETSGLSARASFTQLAQLTLTPSSGLEDSSTSAAVTGFLPGETVRILNGSSSIGSCHADPTGSCSANVDAPVGGAGSYTLTAHGATSGISASATFTVIGAALALSPSSGPAGTQISASASGFLAGETIHFSYNGIAGTQCTADPNGGCIATVTAPPGAGGIYVVSANGQSGGALATATFTQTPTLTVYPPAGLPGSSFQATASGFAAGDIVDFTYGSSAAGSCTADSSGDCAAQLPVPADGPGSHTVTGLGASGLSATATFTETVGLRLTPNLGGVGTTFQADAAGFAPAETVDFSFDGVLERSCQAGTDGTCSATVTVPSLAVGPYPVTATGASSGASISETFSIVPVLTLTPSSGAPGSSFTAAAKGFQPDEEVFVYFGGLGEVGQCAADVTGSCTIPAAVVPPDAAGPANVAAFQPDSAETADASYDVIPSVTLSPSSGPVGTLVSVTARGFSSTAPNGGAETLIITYSGVLVGECAPADAFGSCTTSFVVPAGQPSGANTVLVVDGHGLQANTTFDQFSPALVLSPSAGGQGDSFTASVSNFGAGETVQIVFHGENVGSCGTNASGACSTPANVPADVPAGSYTVAADGSGGDSAGAAFTVQPTLSLTPDAGQQGASFTAEAAGFAAGETVRITFAGTFVGSCSTNGAGDCATPANVPAGLAAATYAVVATGQASSLVASASFNETPSLQLSPPAGPAGSTPLAQAIGFAAGETVNFTYDGVAEGSCGADSFGDCSTHITVPAGVGGSHTVVATGAASGLPASAIFTVTGTLVLSPSAGQPGAPVNANVSGFMPGELVQIALHGESVGSCSTNSSGNCSTPADVPADLPAGSYQVAASGAGGDSAAASFTILPALSVTPSSGAAGSTPLASAVGFAAGETVNFSFAGAPDGQCAANPAGDCTAQITVPAEPAASYQVTATGALSGLSAAASFTETSSIPTVTAVAPNAGRLAGGTAVTITGTNFVAGATVSFGTAKASNVVVVNATTITATSPAGSGTVNVTVTTPGGTSASSSADLFRYLPAPTVSGVSPGSGPTAGGTLVTITGTGFASPASVTFGTVAATGVSVVNATTIKATAPAGGAGSVNVTVTTPGGTSGTSAAGKFTYLVAPTVTKVAPAAGPTGGGTAVTINGTNFVAPVTVTFGGVPASNVVVASGGTITATSPAGSGAVDVTVTTNGGTSALSAADQFTYDAQPTVTAVAPNAGRLAGGTPVTITGTNFVAGATVFFGTAKASNVVVVNATTITATSPAGSAAVNVTVTTPGGTSPTSAADLFTYLPAPTVTGVSPASGPTGGGTVVTVTGTGFVAGATVSFGTAAATNVTVVNPTTIKATAPAETAGSVNVTVTTAGGSSGTSAAGKFTYLVAPTVTKVAPAAGPTGGGTAVTINGTNFVAPVTVTFGGVPASNVVVASGGTITATSPAASSPGAVDVTVTTGGGTSALSAADQFTYDAAPTVTAVAPNAGRLAGGTAVTITGTGFVAGATVFFGIAKASNVVVVNAATITAASPAGSGTVNVTVTTPGGTSPTSSADLFSYLPAPTVTGVSPASGPTGGGTAVTITGTGFVAGATVSFGTKASGNVVVLNSTTITATAPAGSAGSVNVTVTTPGGTSGTSAADKFTYV